MKKEVLVSIFFLLIISLAACQRAKDVMEKKTDVTDKQEDAMEKSSATEDAAVDSVGNDLTNVDSVEKDLDTESLNDIDSGLDDVQNI